jgi:hypothetical protein
MLPRCWADEAPLSNAGAFFPAQQVPPDCAWSKMLSSGFLSPVFDTVGQRRAEKPKQARQ